MPMSKTWRIHEQTTQPLVENQRKPDVIIRTVERHPIAVEVKIDYKRGPNETGEKQAHEYYLGKTLRTTLERVASAIAIRLPYRFRTMPREDIRQNLEASNDFAYALLSVDEPDRFPKKGCCFTPSDDRQTTRQNESNMNFHTMIQHYES